MSGYSKIEWTGWEFVDQIISGGESGRRARVHCPDWHRNTRDFCIHHEIAYFFKQWGAWMPFEQWKDDYHGWTKAHNWNLYSNDSPDMVCVGKKVAGRLLDGREWNELPGGRNA